MWVHCITKPQQAQTKFIYYPRSEINIMREIYDYLTFAPIPWRVINWAWHSSYDNDLSEWSQASPPLSIIIWADLWMNLALWIMKYINKLHYCILLSRQSSSQPFIITLGRMRIDVRAHSRSKKTICHKFCDRLLARDKSTQHITLIFVV